MVGVTAAISVNLASAVCAAAVYTACASKVAVGAGSWVERQAPKNNTNRLNGIQTKMVFFNVEPPCKLAANTSRIHRKIKMLRFEICSAQNLNKL